MTDLSILRLAGIFLKALSAHVAVTSNCPKDVRNLHFNAVDAEIQEWMAEERKREESAARTLSEITALRTRLYVGTAATSQPSLKDHVVHFVPNMERIGKYMQKAELVEVACNELPHWMDGVEKRLKALESAHDCEECRK